MWLVYKGSREASGLKVLNLVVSLGVPKTIGRVHRRTWGAEYTTRESAEDALWVLQRHKSASEDIMGEDVDAHRHTSHLHAHTDGVAGPRPRPSPSCCEARTVDGAL